MRGCAVASDEGLPETGVFLLAVKNGCFYKGALYSQGENWQDGCDFNCTCEDGTTGQYFCIDQSVLFLFTLMVFVHWLKTLYSVCVQDNDVGKRCKRERRISLF